MMRTLLFAVSIATLAIPKTGYSAGTINISNTRALSFGSFAAGTGGTVVVTPASVRTKTGGVVLISAAGGTSAQFSITGNPAGTYSMTLPSNATIASGANTMTINSFTSNPTGTPPVSGTASTLSIGATINVGNNQAPGAYTGSFTVTVIHN